jgi:AraC family transcriptional regulator
MIRKDGQARGGIPGYVGAVTPRDDIAERILRVLVHIQAHLDTPLGLDELARVAHFSPFHFHRVFKGMVGESVAEHVRRLRLERAAGRLRHTDQPVLTVALDAGYESHEGFTRAFRALFGCSPTAFRRSGGRGQTQLPGFVHLSADAGPIRFEPLPQEADAMNVETKQFDPIRAAFLRHVGPYHEVGPTWQRFMAWAGRQGLLGPDTLCFGASWDDPEVTPPDKIRYDACLAVPEGVTPSGEIGVQTIPGGTYAVTLHEGPYERLAQTYEALFGRWLPSSGFEPGDPPSLEFYLNNPETTPPEQLRTEIRASVKACARV